MAPRALMVRDDNTLEIAIDKHRAASDLEPWLFLRNEMRLFLFYDGQVTLLHFPVAIGL